MVKTAQTGVSGTRDSKQGTVAGERVASPAEAMMQASVVARIIACRDELGFPGRSIQWFEHHELRRATRESSTRGSVSEQTRTCATAQRPECQQARAPLNPTFP